MQHATRRPLVTIAGVTAVGALALSPVTVTPHTAPVPVRVSSQVVQLTDAWSDLITHSAQNLVEIGAVFVGANNTFPLPDPTIFVAPIATQLVLNPLIYTVQLLTGQGGKIPNEMLTHLSQVAGVAELLVTQLPGIIVQQLQAPFIAATLALDSITSSTNLLVGLLQAPAVFLDAALNSQYGLIGGNGPIAVPVIVRNLFANALSTPLPTVVLPFKKAGGAEATPKAVPATSVAAPSGVAGSARAGSKKAPANSSRKAGAAKAGTGKPGQGHGKRG